MTERNTHETMVKLVTELVNDGMYISQAIESVAGLLPKYMNHLQGNLFSKEAQAIFDEVYRRQPQGHFMDAVIEHKEVNGCDWSASLAACNVD